MKTSVLLSLLTSAGASLCCILPFLGIAGVSGSAMAPVTWLESYRYAFAGSTFLLLGFAWYNVIRPPAAEACGCERHGSFFHSKYFLSVVTVTSLLLVSFPSYSKLLMRSQEPAGSMDLQDNHRKLTVSVSGMTCASCEFHIEREVMKLSGVSSADASFTGKTATVVFDPRKIDEKQIVAAIDATGYKVQQEHKSVQGFEKVDCCTKGSCTAEKCSTMPRVSVPNERSRNLKVLSGVDELKNAFNEQAGKVKFVAILSSTCGWCLQGAQAVQQAVIGKMAEKDIGVIIVWTNMLRSDDQENAYKAASMFTDPRVVQYFDADNEFGDIVARRLNPAGKKAWDIYMFFDKKDQWSTSLPRPFEYAHQLSVDLHPWTDKTKYFCGTDLTKRLSDITASL